MRTNINIFIQVSCIHFAGKDTPEISTDDAYDVKTFLELT